MAGFDEFMSGAMWGAVLNLIVGVGLVALACKFKDQLPASVGGSAPG